MTSPVTTVRVSLHVLEKGETLEFLRATIQYPGRWKWNVTLKDADVINMLSGIIKNFPSALSITKSLTYREQAPALERNQYLIRLKSLAEGVLGKHLEDLAQRVPPSQPAAIPEPDDDDISLYDVINNIIMALNDVIATTYLEKDSFDATARVITQLADKIDHLCCIYRCYVQPMGLDINNKGSIDEDLQERQRLACAATLRETSQKLTNLYDRLVETYPC
jgi:hypothetical protein